MGWLLVNGQSVALNGEKSLLEVVVFAWIDGQVECSNSPLSRGGF